MFRPSRRFSPFPFRKRPSAIRSLVLMLLGAFAFTLAPHAQSPSPIRLRAARWGHTATSLPGGRILVAGGANGNGPVGSTEVLDFAASQTSAGPPLLTPRSDHTATLLASGLVLIAGGTGATGPLASTELFDPSTGSIVAGPPMTVARAGHTATVLADGSVLIAGGDATGSAEIYRVGGGFSATGGMNAARSGHGAALFADGSVMVAGGADPAGTALNSVEIYSPASGSFAVVGGTMQAARVRPALNVLPDGKVQIIGGDGGFSLEMFDPDFALFKARASVPPLSSLISATLATESRWALVTTAIGSNGDVPGSCAWALDRDGFATAYVGSQVVVVGGAAGGQAIGSAVLFPASGASVTTDFLDYNPGSPVAITGKGWTPGETVTLLIHQEPQMRPDTTLTAVADGTGAIKNYQFTIVAVDVDTVFTVTASGSASGFAAQTAFSDAAVKKYEASISPASDTTNHVSAAYALTITNDPASSNDISSVTINVPVGYTSVVPGAVTTSPAGLNWTASISAGVITLAAATGPDHLAAGQTLTLALTATTPSTRSTYTWVTSTSGSFTLVGSQPAVSLTQASTTTTLGSSPNPSTYGTPVTLTATVAATSGTPTGSVTFYDGITSIGTANLTTTGGVTQAGIQLATLAVGSHTLTATYVADPGFAGSTSAGLMQTVNRATPTITWGNPADITYGTALGATQLNATASVPGTFAYTPASGTMLAAGDSQALAVTFTPSDTTNYTSATKSVAVNVLKAAITVTADAQTKTYGGPDPALTYKVTSGSLVNGDNFSGALTRATGENVGTYAIGQGTLALSNNYTLTYVGANLTITPRPITVTADGKSKVYGDSDPALTYEVTSGSLAFSDAFTGTLARAAGENVGSYAITQGTLALGGNYTLTYVGANLTITPRPITITADGKSKVYGDGDPALTYRVTGGSLAFSDAFTGALTRPSGEAVGSYAITQGSLALNANYLLTYIGANLTITARPITVTADAQSKVYGDPDPAFTYKVTTGSLVGSDAFAGGLTRVSGENVGTYAIQQGSLALTSNYILTYVGANLAITVRPITVTADAKTKVYGDPDPGLTYKVTNGSVVNGDGFAGALTRALGENVGTYAITQGTLALSTNYALAFVGANLTIAQRPITVTADPKTKILGAPDPQLTYHLTQGSLVNGDLFSGALTRAPGETVGAYPIQQGSLALGNNYALSYLGANLNILYATGGLCLGDAGHQILQPINVNGTSVFKQGSTTPAKFRVCDANGASVGTPGVVASFRLVQTISGTVTNSVDDTVASTTPDAAFRWDSTAQQWIFNISSKSWAANTTYVFLVTLNDGTPIQFQYGLK